MEVIIDCPKSHNVKIIELIKITINQEGVNMKKHTYLFVVFLSLLLVLPADAQKIQVGIMGGLNFADMDLKTSTGTDRLTSSRTLSGIGGVLDLNLGQYTSLVVEPKYLQKGGTQKATISDPDIDMKMNFLEIPIFLKVAYGEVIRPYVKVGPSIGLLLSSNAEGEVGGVVSGQPLKVYEADLNDVLESIDFGISVGAGVSLLLGKNTIFLDGRYTFGLVDLWKGGTIEWKSGADAFTVNSAEEAELSTKGFQIMFGVIFPFGGK